MDVTSYNSETNFANYMHLLSVPGNVSVPKMMGNLTIMTLHVQTYIYSPLAILNDINLNNLHKTKTIFCPPSLLTEG